MVVCHQFLSDFKNFKSFENFWSISIPQFQKWSTWMHVGIVSRGGGHFSTVNFGLFSCYFTKNHVFCEKLTKILWQLLVEWDCGVLEMKVLGETFLLAKIWGHSTLDEKVRWGSLLSIWSAPPKNWPWHTNWIIGCLTFHRRAIDDLLHSFSWGFSLV